MNRREFVTGVAALLPIAGQRRSSAEQLPVPKTYTYKVASGCVLKADVYGADVSANKPAIVWIH
ncbi:MAG: hypothetical protein ACRD2O_11920, partial [Terriglobia bacterium]